MLQKLLRLFRRTPPFSVKIDARDETIAALNAASERIRQAIPGFYHDEAARSMVLNLPVATEAPPPRILLDARYLVWRRDQRGKINPSLWLLNPKGMFNWEHERDMTVEIIELTDDDRAMSFAEIAAKYPPGERTGP